MGLYLLIFNMLNSLYALWDGFECFQIFHPLRPKSTLHVEYLGPGSSLLNEGVEYLVNHPEKYQGIKVKNDSRLVLKDLI